MRAAAARSETVVVGVDGSPGARAALEFAVDEAGRRGAQVLVVTAVQRPEYWAALGGVGPIVSSDDITAGVRSAAQHLIEEALADREPVPVTLQVAGGYPAEVLIEAAQDAALLVLGHRGRGAIGSAVLGSVGLQCILHAACPVTVVRPEPSPTEPVPDAAAAATSS